MAWGNAQSTTSNEVTITPPRDERRLERGKREGADSGQGRSGKMRGKETAAVAVPLLNTVRRDDLANSPMPRDAVNKMMFKGTNTFLMIAVVRSWIKYIVLLYF